jgi:TolB protein
MIVFTSNRGGSHQIYVMDADGANQRQVTSGFDRADGAAWSPDGRRIAFVGSRDGKSAQIHVMNADGSGQTQVTNETPGVPTNRLVWSPDGAQIAFARNYRIHVINADGSAKRSVGWSGSLDTFDWSPDGTKFVFSGLSSDADRQFGLFVIGADGSGVTRLTSGRHDNPAWSSDGQRIAFNRPNQLGQGAEIYVMNADGSGATAITPGKYARMQPVWSPDDQKIAFHMNPLTNNIDIYVMNADGSGEARLTSDPGADIRPNWHPSPHQRRRLIDTGRPGGLGRELG